MTEGKMDINEATVDDIMKVPNIGKERAEMIVRWRDEHGPFDKIDDVDKVPNISGHSMDAISSYFEVAGGNTRGSKRTQDDARARDAEAADVEREIRDEDDDRGRGHRKA